MICVLCTVCKLRTVIIGTSSWSMKLGTISSLAVVWETYLYSQHLKLYSVLYRISVGSVANGDNFCNFGC